jgi:hypothetical protein
VLMAVEQTKYISALHPDLQKNNIIWRNKL